VAGGVTQQTRPFTDVVTDPSGLFAGTVAAQGNGYQAGVGGLQNFSAVFTGSLNVPAAGPASRRTMRSCLAWAAELRV